jgi:hypothetical protein
MLPVHAKIAALFMRGVPIREAVKRVNEIRQLLPVQDQGRCQALVDFMRVAVSDDGNGTAMGNTSWGRVDPGASAALEEWCFEWLGVLANQYYVPVAQNPVLLPIATPDQTVSPALTGADLMAAFMAAQELAGRRADPTAEKNPGFSKYSPLEIEKILTMTHYGPRDGLGTESMPSFWQEFENNRKTVRSARAFLESYFERVRATEADSVGFYLSNSLVNAFRDLRFSSPRAYNWGTRHTGLSMFAIAPDSPSNSASRDARAAATLRLEMTLHNPTSADQNALDAMVGNEEGIPITWGRVKEFIKHDIQVMRSIFGLDCVGLSYAQEIYDLVASGHPCRGYKSITYATLAWKYHIARMEIFFDVRAGSLRALRDKVQNSEAPLMSDFQEGVQLQLELACGSVNPQSDRKRAPTADADRDEVRHQKQPRREVVSEIAKGWAEEIKMARTAVAPLSLSPAMLCPDPAATARLLGSDFVALFKKKTPCRQMFLLGTCSYGSECRFAHTPASNPSAAIISGIKTRLQARAQELAQQAKN